MVKHKAGTWRLLLRYGIWRGIGILSWAWGVLGNLWTSCKYRRGPSAVTPGKHFQSEKYLAFLVQVIRWNKAKPQARNTHQILSQWANISTCVCLWNWVKAHLEAVLILLSLDISLKPRLPVPWDQHKVGAGCKRHLLPRYPLSARCCLLFHESEFRTYALFLSCIS